MSSLDDKVETDKVETQRGSTFGPTKPLLGKFNLSKENPGYSCNRDIGSLIEIKTQTNKTLSSFN